MLTFWITCSSPFRKFSLCLGVYRFRESLCIIGLSLCNSDSLFVCTLLSVLVCDYSFVCMFRFADINGFI